METENRLIAEFMGYKKSIANTWFKGNKIVQTTSFKYDSDWNWLMKVVEKIESIKIETYKVRVDIYFNCCQIYPTHWDELISIYGNNETKLQTTYKAVIEFIKWYNEQK